MPTLSELVVGQITVPVSEPSTLDDCEACGETVGAVNLRPIGPHNELLCVECGERVLEVLPSIFQTILERYSQ